MSTRSLNLRPVFVNQSLSSVPSHTLFSLLYTVLLSSPTLSPLSLQIRQPSRPRSFPPWFLYSRLGLLFYHSDFGLLLFLSVTGHPGL